MIIVLLLYFFASLYFTSDLWAEEEKRNQEEKVSEASAEKKTEKKSPHTFTGSVTFVSDYRDRGISQTMRQPSVQGELKYMHESGVYVKTDGYNVDGTGHFIHNTSMEWDFFIGLKREIFHTSVYYDIGLLYYYYPGGQAFVPAETSYNTLEYYIAASYQGLEIKLSLTVNDYFANNSDNPPMNWAKGRPSRPNGHSYGSPYFEANFEKEFYPQWTLSLHLGYQGVTHYPQLNYLDWLVGLSRQFEWFTLSVSYIASNARHAYYDVPDSAFRPRKKHLGAGCIVVGVSRTF